MLLRWIEYQIYMTYLSYVVGGRDLPRVGQSVDAIVIHAPINFEKQFIFSCR